MTFGHHLDQHAMGAGRMNERLARMLAADQPGSVPLQVLHGARPVIDDQAQGVDALAAPVEEPPQRPASAPAAVSPNQAVPTGT